MEINFSFIKRPIFWITTLSSLSVSFVGIYEGYTAITNKMNQTAQEKIKTYTLPVVRSEINKTVDSIFSIRKVSFREELSKKLDIKEEEIYDFFYNWHLSQTSRIYVGVYYDTLKKKLFYIHTNGQIYRPFKDSLGFFYFINDNDKSEYCK